MKRYWTLGLVLVPALFAFAPSPVEAQAPRIAYVDMDRVIREAPGSAEAQKQLQGEADRTRAELGKLQQELQQLQADFEKQAPTLTAAARQQREQEFTKRVTAFQQRTKQAEETFAKRQEEVTGPIFKRAAEALEAVRKQGNYAMIFHAASAPARDPSLDVTSQVLARLRATPQR